MNHERATLGLGSSVKEIWLGSKESAVLDRVNLCAFLNFCIASSILCQTFLAQHTYVHSLLDSRKSDHVVGHLHQVMVWTFRSRAIPYVEKQLTSRNYLMLNNNMQIRFHRNCPHLFRSWLWKGLFHHDSLSHLRARYCESWKKAWVSERRYKERSWIESMEESNQLFIQGWQMAR